MRLLLVEDDAELSNALQRGFRDEGFAVDAAFDGPDGLHAARSGEHDLLVLDVMLPGFDGFRLLKTLRDEGHRVPVIFLTARGEITDRVEGFRRGGDDYLVKPFSFEELLARVRAVLRRAAGVGENRLRHRELVLDLDGREVWWQDRPIPLTPKELAILEALLLQEGKVLSRIQLVQHVYDQQFDADSNVVDVHIANLRRKLTQACGEPLLETVRGTGFRIPRGAA